MEARTTSGNGQKVLVISSYSPIKEEGNHLIASFIDQMQVDSEAKIFVEYMDCEASPVFETWVGWMRQLFAAMPFDLCRVMAAQDPDKGKRKNGFEIRAMIL